jgi:hypothetical protein
MGNGWAAIAGLLLWVSSALTRLVLSLIKCIVVVGVIIGAAHQVVGHAPASWPEFRLNVPILFEYLSLSVETAARSWLPLGVAAVVLWTWQCHRIAVKVGSDITQVKIGIVGLGNYLDIGIETDGMREIKEKGLLRSTLDAWKMNLALKFLMGRMDDDALTAKPARLHSGSGATLQGDLADLVNRRS